MGPMEFSMDTDKAYQRSAAKLVEMMDARDRHASSDQECTAAPLCIGPAAGMDLVMLRRERPQVVGMLILTAVGELCRYRAELTAAQAWKRDLVAQLERTAEDHDQEIREMRARNASLIEVVGDLQRQIGERS